MHVQIPWLLLERLLAFYPGIGSASVASAASPPASEPTAWPLPLWGLVTLAALVILALAAVLSKRKKRD